MDHWVNVAFCGCGANSSEVSGFYLGFFGLVSTRLRTAALIWGGVMLCTVSGSRDWHSTNVLYLRFLVALGDGTVALDSVAVILVTSPPSKRSALPWHVPTPHPAKCDLQGLPLSFHFTAARCLYF